MYRIKIKSGFCGAHKLRGYKGKCEALHGHNWLVEVEVQAEELDATGMVIDFKELKDLLNEVIVEMDHKYLNEMVYFEKVNPTSENIARYIHETVSGKRPDLVLGKVTVWETDSSSAVYSG
ncbi:MAG: 6-carboxytetrahydropterin synthase QueD [Candidatus Omnitrophica bacterium]|nr:6-carboxytetrahydropterin synthase QueD [Candidatus Omnitrophota bacterium]